MVEALLLSFLRSLSSTNHVRFSQIGHVQPSGTKVCTWPFSGTASSSRAARDAVKWPAEGLGLVEGPFQLPHCGLLVSNSASLMEPEARRFRICSPHFGH